MYSASINVTRTPAWPSLNISLQFFDTHRKQWLLETAMGFDTAVHSRWGTYVQRTISIAQRPTSISTLASLMEDMNGSTRLYLKDCGFCKKSLCLLAFNSYAAKKYLVTPATGHQ